MKNSKYRTNAYSIKEIHAYNDMADIIPTVFQTLDVDINQMSKDDYMLWIETWKHNYQAVSTLSKYAKTEDFSPASQRMIRLCAKISNTMLNGRRYAKDQRRQSYLASKDSPKVSEEILVSVAS